LIPASKILKESPSAGDHGKAAISTVLNSVLVVLDAVTALQHR